jgi:outer membrane receptor for ferrienterochelin and colicin
MKIKIALLILVMVPVGIAAQNRYKMAGKVLEANSNKPVELVAVQIKELNRWTTSDMSGNFTIPDIPAGNYTLLASCLGYDKYEKPVTISGDMVDFRLLLNQLSLGLEEVIVVAKENTSLSSSSKIESSALEHVQPTGLADVMQLVPGQITVNPDMSGNNQITIRDINSWTSRVDANSSLGTAVIIDGTPVNNSANMQTLNTASGGISQGYSTAGQGVDMRQISADNIESVEVIRGIPSVEYGNLTTGAVLVKTKAGKTKFNIKVKADPNIKQTAFSKGFTLPGNNNGALNFDLDYTQAYDDMREPTSSYRRITGQIGYSNTWFKATIPLSLNAKILHYNTFDNQKSDPDMQKTEIFQNKEQSFGFKLYGNWGLKKSWITNLEYNFSGDFNKQKFYEYKISSGGVTPMPLAMESGEAVGEILPSSYFSELTIDGRPYNYFGQLKGNKTGRWGQTLHHLMAGAEWRTSGNNGLGQLYDRRRPPYGSTSSRPRAFKDIPASNELSLFLEDKMSFPVGKTTVNAQGGIRYTNLLPKGLFATDAFTTFEPRINLTYDIFRNRKTGRLKSLSLRFGYGKTSKTPGMIYLYPDKSYEDQLSFNYYPDLIVVTTKVITDTSNPDLKPTMNTKNEVGIDFHLFGINFMFTAFMENLKDGFSYTSQYFVMNYRKWDPLAGTGKNPVFENGNVYYTENGQKQTLHWSPKNDFVSYLMPLNNYNIHKKGLEYVIDFGKIPAIQSSFRIDGAWYYISKIDEVIPYYQKVNITWQGDKFPYLPVFPGNEGTLKQRLNTNMVLDTHIPKIKMVVSLTGMLIWFNKTTYTWTDTKGNDIAWSLGSNNEKLYGNYENTDNIYIDPIGYYDWQMVYHAWENNYSFTSPFIFMVKQSRHDYFSSVNYPFTWQINLKLTKEFGDKAKLSFFANNVFNYRPLSKDPRSDSWFRQNQPAYFGAELKFTL